MRLKVTTREFSMSRPGNGTVFDLRYVRLNVGPDL